MTSQPEKEGLKLKYLLTKVDGSPVGPDGDYFIIKLNSKTRWHQEASIKAILAYAESVKNDAPQLAVDIITKYGCASHSNASERDKVLNEIEEYLPNLERSYMGEQVDTYIYTKELKDALKLFRTAKDGE